MHPRFIVTLLILGSVWAGTQAQAEVRAITDRDGNFLETRFLFHEEQTCRGIWSGVWAPVGWVRQVRATLNPSGDWLGDHWPVVADTGLPPYHAWAVWSRRDGLDYDLVWSRWSSGRWRLISLLHPGDPGLGDDLDPDLAIDASGRPYVVWWRDENGVGRVYLSLFLISQWMAAYPVSEIDVDSRYPTVRIDPDGEILVTYETPEGLLERTVLFDEPVTITDDIDPLDCVLNGGTRNMDNLDP